MALGKPPFRQMCTPYYGPTAAPGPFRFGVACGETPIRQTAFTVCSLQAPTTATPLETLTSAAHQRALWRPAAYAADVGEGNGRLSSTCLGNATDFESAILPGSVYV